MNSNAEAVTNNWHKFTKL